MAEDQDQKTKTLVSTHTYADGEKAPERWYQGRSGKTSAKRISGIILVIGGLTVAILSVILGYDKAEDILWPVLSAATLLLGSGVLERFGNNKGGDK